jgi:hypothetical protein
VKQSLFLNGWRRAFVVVSVAYGLLVYYQQVMIPDNSFFAFISPSLIADRDSLAVAQQRFGNQQEVSQFKAKVEGDESVINSHHRVNELQALIYWLVPLTALYVCGEAIAWVVRGFRRERIGTNGG